MNRIRVIARNILALDTRVHSVVASRFPRTFRVLDWILENFLAFVSHPAFALIAALVLVPLVDSGKISLVNAFCAWGAWVIAVIWISRTVKFLPILSRFVVVFGLAAILAVGSSALVRWSARAYLASQTPTGPNADAASAPLSFEVERHVQLWYTGHDNFPPFMFTFASPTNPVAPVYYLLYLQVTNEGQFSASIESYSMDFWDSASDTWTPFIRLPLSEGNLYRSPGGMCTQRIVPSPLAYPRGTYRFAPAKPTILPRRASLLQVQTLESQLEDSITPGQTVFGREAFDIPDYANHPIEKMRIHLYGTNKRESTVDVPDQPLQGREVTDPHAGLMSIIDTCTDLTHSNLIGGRPLMEEAPTPLQ